LGNSGKLWEDPEFPTNETILYKNPKDNKDKPVVEWKRPSELNKDAALFVDGNGSGDVVQGALGDCYYLGSLSCIATREELLQPLFVGKYPQHGFYQVKFFINGEWQVRSILV
jgi:hypothetical protein